MNPQAPISEVQLSRQEVEQIKNGFVLITEVQKALDLRMARLETSQNQNQVQDSETMRQLARINVILEQVQQRSIEQKDSLTLIPDISYKLSTLSRDFDQHKIEGKEQSKEQSTKFNALQNGLIIASFGVIATFIATQIVPYLGYNRPTPSTYNNVNPK